MRSIWLMAALTLGACDDGGDAVDGGAVPDAAAPDAGPVDGSPAVDMAGALDATIDGGADAVADATSDAMTDAAMPDAAPDVMFDAMADAIAPDAIPPDAMLDAGAMPDAMPDATLDPDVGPPPPVEALYTADFEGGDAEGWPAPWVVSGGVDAATVADGMACLVPTLSGYSLGRMAAPLGARDVEVLFSLRFSDVARQGVGFYVRQNGAYLDQDDPPGSGYAVFVEGFRGDGIGVWREVDGHEQDIRIVREGVPALVDGVRYRVRFRVTRRGGVTDLRARYWPEGEPEPRRWQVEATDDRPELQEAAAGIAIDSWNTWTSADPGPDVRPPTCVDDIEIRAIDNPLDALGPVELLAEGFVFTEGPLWLPDAGALLFTDIPADTIYRLVPGEAATPEVRPSGNANGLALNPDGMLVACEHAGQVVRDPGGVRAVLASTFEGEPLHSPNDLAIRDDGTIWFTDPPYGRGGVPGPLPFIGVFRITPDGALTAEHRGGLGERPNGVALSPDGQVLYVADTSAGALYAFDVAPDGALSDRRLMADGLPSADGMAVAPDGTIYVATGRGVVALDAEGNEWGVVEVPRQPSNCTLGPDGTLYVTAREGVYRVPAR